MAADQNKQWRAALQEARKLSDNLGEPLDEGVVETVAILRLMGVYTIMSCEGHTNRLTYGPYIIFDSPEAKKYRQSADKVGDEESSVRKRLIEKAYTANVHEKQKIFLALEAFYRERKVLYRSQLIIWGLDLGTNYLYCQGADLAHLMEQQERENLLKANQIEMKAFTEFLKKLYFAQKEN